MAGGYYDAWSGNYGAGYRGGNQYSRWGEGVVGEGDDWVHAKYRVEKGQGGALGIETSEGEKFLGVGNGENRGFIAKDDDNNIYAGQDGNVYRRDEDGDWHKNVDGDWEEVPKEQVDSARQQAQQRSDEARQQRTQGGQGAQPHAASTTTSQNTSASRSAEGRAQPGASAPTARATQQGATDLTRTDRGSSAASSDVMRSLESEARARYDGAARSRQYSSWQRSGGGSSGRGGRRRR